MSLLPPRTHWLLRTSGTQNDSHPSPFPAGRVNFHGADDPQRVIGLDHIDAPLDRLQVLLHAIVLSEGVGEHLDVVGVAAVDQLLGQDLPGDIEPIGFDRSASAVDPVRTCPAGKGRRTSGAGNFS